MKKVWIVIAVLVVALGALYLGRNKIKTMLGASPAQNSITSQTQTNSQNVPTQNQAFSGSFFDLAQRGGDVKCTWSNTDKNMSIQGSVYASGKKFNVVSNATVSGVSGVTYIIGDGTKMYVWTSNTGNSGFIMNYPDVKNQTGATNQQQQLLQKYNFQCSPWIVDASKFQLPANINFR